MTDLGKRLRDAATHRESFPPDEHGVRVLSAYLDRAKALMTEAADALDALYDRLEMRHAYNGDGDRIDVAPGSIPDGIECRDETIKLLQTRLDARWQTMENAPKDGSRVTLFVPPYGAGSGHYDERAGKWVAHFTLYEEAQPTHWHPLPTPPEDE